MFCPGSSAGRTCPGCENRYHCLARPPGTGHGWRDTVLNVNLPFCSVGSLSAFSSPVTCLLHHTRREQALLPPPATASWPVLSHPCLSLSLYLSLPVACCQTSSLQLYLPHLHTSISICFACPSLTRVRKRAHAAREVRAAKAGPAGFSGSAAFLWPRGRRVPHEGRLVRAWRVHGGQDWVLGCLRV